MIAKLLAASIVLASLVGPLSSQQANSLDPRLAESTVLSFIDVFNREYFDVGISSRVEVELRKGLAEGRYAAARAPNELTTLLNRDVFAIAQDKHVDVRAIVPRPPGAPSERRDTPTTAGFRRTEVLPGNVGLLDLAFFLRLVEHRDAMTAAMAKLQTTDALILDMRDNSGGSPDTVALLMSYLFERPGMPLFDITPRRGERQMYSTTTDPIAYRDASRPVVVLTSSKSFSGGEGIAFLLQDHKRAVIIGEPTAGAANPGRPYPINDQFEVVVPNGQLLSAISRKNWEGDGVMPDMRVDAADALRIGHMQAIQALLKASTPGPRRDELRAVLKSLEADKK
ncbi:MAG: S41 family peptidase [Acidobacteriota bacterium]|nr:S41 family peptidase [Acidobacteriota bacterium]